MLFFKVEIEPANIEVGEPSTSKVDIESDACEENPSSAVMPSADTVVPDTGSARDISLTCGEDVAPAI